ncbi:hypothetical protein [Paraburkholderia sp. BL17N1]|uniref:hypothetical protein n=1 Tax=Paraburkholderia sp. BL17N1 TaxID=1938798 RepID=UPI001F542F0B|nr:hypothetical protein [Paraburkholderia sp. BL17N1]
MQSHIHDAGVGRDARVQLLTQNTSGIWLRSTSRGMPQHTPMIAPASTTMAGLAACAAATSQPIASTVTKSLCQLRSHLAHAAAIDAAPIVMRT